MTITEFIGDRTAEELDLLWQLYVSHCEGSGIKPDISEWLVWLEEEDF